MESSDVRFGSLADIRRGNLDVRLTPESRRAEDQHSRSAFSHKRTSATKRLAYSSGAGGRALAALTQLPDEPGADEVVHAGAEAGLVNLPLETHVEIVGQMRAIA